MRIEVDKIQEYLDLEAKKIGVMNVRKSVEGVTSERIRIHPVQTNRTHGIDVALTNRVRMAIIQDLDQIINDTVAKMEELCT